MGAVCGSPVRSDEAVEPRPTCVQTEAVQHETKTRETTGHCDNDV